MAKIPFLHAHPRACGTLCAWHWKPSPRLRALGWTNRHLGDGPMPKRGKPAPPAIVVAKALELNEALAASDKASGAAQAPLAPRLYRFDDLRDAYRASEDFRSLRQKTRTEYDIRLRQLRSWADDGQLPIRAIDKGMVRDLRDGLTEGGAGPHKVAAILRVLRLLLNWAMAQDLLESNAVYGVKIRTAPARSVVIPVRDAEAAAVQAEAMGWPSVALHLRLALWMMQRQADLLGLNRMAWRVMENCDPADAAVLAGRKDGRMGQVMGFRLRQSKTGAWLDVPVLPEFHAAIETAFETSQWLFPEFVDESRPADHPQFAKGHLLQRRGRKALDAVGLEHAQLRDFRRSGMCMFRDFGVEDSLTTSMSGHAVLGHKTILDTYMPKNTRAACAALATAQRARLARQQREEAR